MKIIAGNWKMNGTRVALDAMLGKLCEIKTDNRVILCVPFTMLRPGCDAVAIGAQDISQHPAGAHTGDISAAMISDAGAKYVIVGHSERRAAYGETNDIVRAKAAAAIEFGITPIICVGETAAERDAGKTMEIIERAVRESVPKNTKQFIIAYEPRWAIGTGITPTANEIRHVHKHIANILGDMGVPAPILYGGGVNSKNSTDIMDIENVDGVLVGGASLKPDDFIPIIMGAK